MTAVVNNRPAKTKLSPTMVNQNLQLLRTMQKVGSKFSMIASTALTVKTANTSAMKMMSYNVQNSRKSIDELE